MPERLAVQRPAVFHRAMIMPPGGRAGSVVVLVKNRPPVWGGMQFGGHQARNMGHVHHEQGPTSRAISAKRLNPVSWDRRWPRR